MLDEENTKYLYECGILYTGECAKLGTEFTGNRQDKSRERKITDMWLILWIISSREHNRRKEMLLDIIHTGCPV